MHRGYIDEAVAGERIRAILGVPLVARRRGDRGPARGAPVGAAASRQAEVSLLTSFAAHAVGGAGERPAVRRARRGQPHPHRAHRGGRARGAGPRPADRPAARRRRRRRGRRGARRGARRRGGGARRPAGELLAGDATAARRTWAEAVAEAVASGRSVETDGGYVAAALAGTEHVATLVLRRDEPLDLAERRTLERGALVTALVLLFARSVAEAEERLGGAAARRPAARPTPRRASGCATAYAGTAPASTAPLVVAAATVDGADRHRGRAAPPWPSRGAVAAWPASTAARWSLLVPGEDPRRVGAELQARSWPSRRQRDRRRRRAGDALDGDRLVAAHDEARRCLDTLRHASAAPARSATRRARRGPAAARRQRPRAARRLRRRPRSARCAAWTTRRGAPVWWTTLEAWFASGGRLKETAAALHVHPNTVTQRLDRVGELLGAGWRDPERALDLQLALRVHRLQRRLTRHDGVQAHMPQASTVALRAHVLSVTRRPYGEGHDHRHPVAPARPRRTPGPGDRRRQRHRRGRRRPPRRGRRRGPPARPRRRGRGQGRRAGRTAPPHVVDLTDAAAIDALDLDVDILVNNAGIQHVAPIEDFDPERFRADPRADAARAVPAGPPRAARHVRPRAGAGSSTSRASTATARRPYKSAYVSAKHGLEGLSKVIALEARRQGRHQQHRLPRLRPHAARRGPDRRPGARPRHRRGRGPRRRPARPHPAQAAGRARGGRRRGGLPLRPGRRLDDRLLALPRRRLDRRLSPDPATSPHAPPMKGTS